MSEAPLYGAAEGGPGKLARTPLEIRAFGGLYLKKTVNYISLNCRAGSKGPGPA